VPGIGVGRDGARTPMQWDASNYAGFSDVEPWLPLADDHGEDNVERQRADPGSIYNLYRRLIAIRRARPALKVGSYRLVVASGDLLLFLREAHATLLIALNFGEEPALVNLPPPYGHGRVLVSTHADRDDQVVDGPFELRSYEGLVIDLGPID
jgi:alpha-glucosidase